MGEWILKKKRNTHTHTHITHTHHTHTHTLRVGERRRLHVSSVYLALQLTQAAGDETGPAFQVGVEEASVVVFWPVHRGLPPPPLLTKSIQTSTADGGASTENPELRDKDEEDEERVLLAD
eukprot:NODE_3280_length_793_cov_28.923387_g2739_i0.p1 GENE.NODE_3280_length_793_cov_28.923387_g2739_i0~~NODE_3280_length_793_cov_28.923387_g2739_i0.p1  ORF type:complete len:121 (+),score=35.44 NODE_3280_length_793_cov_28.923387_g2739_i0:280-642(+)